MRDVPFHCVRYRDNIVITYDNRNTLNIPAVANEIECMFQLECKTEFDSKVGLGGLMFRHAWVRRSGVLSVGMRRPCWSCAGRSAR